MSIAYILQGSKEEWNLTTFQIGIMGSIYQAGILVGGLFWGYISDKYGRSPAFKSTAIFGVLSSISLVTSYNNQIATVSLFTLGISMGGELILATTVFCEFCPPSKRYYLTMLSLFFSLGAILITFTALIVSITNKTNIYNWRIIVGSGCIIEMLLFIFRFYLPETPAFYISKGNIKGAEKVLNIISIKNTGKEFTFIELDANLSDIYELSKSSMINTENSKPTSEKGLWHEICKRKILKIAIILSLVILIQGVFFHFLLSFWDNCIYAWIFECIFYIRSLLYYFNPTAFRNSRDYFRF